MVLNYAQPHIRIRYTVRETDPRTGFRKVKLKVKAPHMLKKRPLNIIEQYFSSSFSFGIMDEIIAYTYVCHQSSANVSYWLFNDLIGNETLSSYTQSGLSELKPNKQIN